MDTTNTSRREFMRRCLTTGVAATSFAALSSKLPASCDPIPIYFYPPVTVPIKTITKMVRGRMVTVSTPAPITHIVGGSQFIVKVQYPIAAGPGGAPLTFQITATLPGTGPAFYNPPTPQQIIANYNQVVNGQVLGVGQTTIYILVDTNPVLYDVNLNFMVSATLGGAPHCVKGSILITRLSQSSAYDPEGYERNNDYEPFRRSYDFP